MWISKVGTIGTKGSENGTIINDEENPHGARITLEQNGYTPFGITCGIYGLMCHTAFASEYEEAMSKYEEMKQEIEFFFSNDIDETDWCEQFTDKF